MARRSRSTVTSAAGGGAGLFPPRGPPPSVGLKERSPPGKAVALDRDERGGEALDLIRRQGIASFDEFKDEFRAGNVFYVPAGEEFYYFGLIYEAFGYYNESLANWKLFISSGAHPQFQARA